MKVIVMPSERKRVTRSGSTYTFDRHGFNTLVKDEYKKLNYTHTYTNLLKSLQFVLSDSLSGCQNATLHLILTILQSMMTEKVHLKLS